MKHVCLALAALAAGCGDGGAEATSGAASPQQGTPGSSTPAASYTWTAEQHTPGFFRNMYRIQLVQEPLDDTTAVDRLLGDFPARIEQKDELPSLLPMTEQTIDALMITSLRGMQANIQHAGRARQVSEAMFVRLLALDPARAAWNEAGNPQVAAHNGGPAFVASAALEALSLTASGQDTECQPLGIEHQATWQPDESQLVWVPERCEPDRYVGGYCEPDRFIEGECVSRWVEEECDGGAYESYGRYEYRCRSDGECDYIWRPRLQYVPGSCTGGYYDEYCYSDRYERGLCYPDTFVPGFCDGGQWEWRAPGGTWSSPQVAVSGGSTVNSALTNCSWDSQRAVAEVALGALTELMGDWLEPYWDTAARSLLSTADSQDDRTLVDAAVQLLATVEDAGLEPINDATLLLLAR